LQKITELETKSTIENGVKNLLENINQFEKAPVWTPNKIKKETKIWFKYLK
jgi:UDP-glucose 4-epimerase